MRFEEFASAHGVLIQHAIADGRIHRCATKAHPRSKNGAYRWTGEWGWVQAWEEHEGPIVYRADGVSADVVHRDTRRFRAEEEREQVRARGLAQEILACCTVAEHPYLDRKGHKGVAGLVTMTAHDIPMRNPRGGREFMRIPPGTLVVPMRDALNYRVTNSLQFIQEGGSKLFLPWGKSQGSVFVRGSGEEMWFCEGLATGLSVEAALKSMYRQARVVICFSASNIAHVAPMFKGRRFVVADNDSLTKSAGEVFAKRTGLPWVMPDEPGTDANDLHQAHGVRALVSLMRRAMT